jgi:uncharacterized protein YjbI with pentapeptide repeats
MRWDTAEGRLLAADVSAWLHGRERRPPKGLGLVEGRVDLRGIAMHHLDLNHPTGKRGDIVRVVWNGLDFRGARLDHMRWFSVRIENCAFDDASLDQLRVWESTIVDTSLDHAKLNRAAIGTGDNYRRNVWERVSFRRANLRDAHVHNADLYEVDFSNANLRGVSFRHARLEGVVFAGLMREVLFENRDFSTDNAVGYPMKSVDFRNAEFHDVEFRGSHFESVSFPLLQEHLLVSNFPAAARYVLDRIATDESSCARGLRAILAGELRLPGDEDATGVFIRADLIRWRDEAFADFVFDHFRQAALALRT